MQYGCVFAIAVALLSGTAVAQDKESLLNALGNTNPDPLPPGGPAPDRVDNLQLVAAKYRD